MSAPRAPVKPCWPALLFSEAGVAFFSIAGSEFVEMFVGMGASKVRDLFKQANEKSPLHYLY